MEFTPNGEQLLVAKADALGTILIFDPNTCQKIPGDPLTVKESADENAPPCRVK